MAAMAKAYANDAYRDVSAHNIQIHGGVGFTWEYDCHLYYKRAKSDEAWLGGATHHRERVARMLDL
jgi:alkylation response protein AidB-like acyl-CoA dehydrogenase